ncbi:hypothetical protein T4D_6089 [Trichinella pseudospiralis]|uniref:Uncharacterized protein n=1 Tax=Trichinella pseudospiralis TaxID=6337 RepID=A0A0V1G419_TRIPS|nr:hypothetical protein T4D_6089 [Trichinella pseudospiralis]
MHYKRKLYSNVTKVSEITNVGMKEENYSNVLTLHLFATVTWYRKFNSFNEVTQQNGAANRS